MITEGLLNQKSNCKH